MSTAADLDLIKPYVTSTDEPVFALVGLPEEVIAALFAKYSRQQGGLRENLVALLELKAQFDERAQFDEKEQPAPVPNDKPAVWELVMADVTDSIRGLDTSDGRHRLATQVLTDMAERHAVGTKRYGTPLQAFNGRNVLQDAYEEALDLCVYLRQALAEGKPVARQYTKAREMVLDLRATMVLAA